jgi:D-alanyl-D-alanine carboxypeptidase (penicillin-binding protein 5/6)
MRAPRSTRPSPTSLVARRSLAAVLVGLIGLLLVGTPVASATTGPVGPLGGSRLGRPGVVYVPGPGIVAPPVTSSLSYVVADTTSGDVLAAKGAHLRLRPASTQKILTALTLLPELDPGDVYTARFEDANVDGSKVGIVPDAPYEVHDLWQALFLVSGNDAANALANASGGVAQAVRKMQDKARELQALDTTVVNPSGLDAPRQFSSAYDLALIARAGLQREDFRAYCATNKAQFPGKVGARGPRPTFEIYTQDKLLLNYSGAIGVKTGFTTLARATYVGAATRGGRTLVVTLMHAGPRAWREAAALLDWGFAQGPRITPVGHLVDPVTEGGGTEPTAGSGLPALGASALPAVAHAGAAWTPPVWAWVVVVLVAMVLSLRTRTLVRRRRRRRRLSSAWSRG